MNKVVKIGTVIGLSLALSACWGPGPGDMGYSGYHDHHEGGMDGPDNYNQGDGRGGQNDNMGNGGSGDRM